MYKKLLFTSVSALVLAANMPAMAADDAAIDLSQKPVATPTLTYLHEQGVKMPDSDQVFPESVYTITPITDEDAAYTFEIISKNETGEFVNQRYLVDLKIDQLGTSKNITWQEVDEAGTDVIEVQLPNETKYFKYAYNKPADYTKVTGNENRIDGTLDAANAEKKLFEGISGYTEAYLISGSTYGGGGVIANVDQDKSNVDINADFIGNHSESSDSRTDVLGGAIMNYANSGQTAKLGDITGDFIGNYTQSTSYYNSAYGGAISNYAYNSTDTAQIGNITGDFIGNYAKSESDYASGGAISNHTNFSGRVEIGNITGDFIGNYVQGSSSYARGGAIYNSGTINSITGDFIGNYAISTLTPSSSYSPLPGGAIYNDGTINSITGDFIGNYVKTTQYSVSGGAIVNSGNRGTAQIGDITGDFIGNYAKSEQSYAQGGAISNYVPNSSYTAQIGDITGDFIGNYAKSEQSYAQGGAIYNEAFLSSTAQIGNITGDFIGNYAKSEQSYAQGGAIYNTGTKATINIINSNFFGNYVEGKAEVVQYGFIYKTAGGAIYSSNDLKITADNGTSEFTGNYVLADGVKTPNAIYMGKTIDLSSSGNLSSVTPDQIPNLNLNAVNNGQIIFNDEIDGKITVRKYVRGSGYTTLGELNYNLNIDGDESGHVYFNNHIYNADITLENVTTNLSDIAYLNNNNSLTINSGKFNVTQFGVDDVLTANAITINGGVLNIASADVDFTAGKMGQFENITVGDAGKINVENFVIINAGEEEKEAINVAFGDENSKAAVTTSVTEALAPIYKYSVVYNAESGEFEFTRGDKIVPDPIPDPIPSTPIRPITPSYKAFNPGVFSGDVLAMSSLNTQNAAVDQVLTQATVLDTDRGRVWATPYYSDDTIEYKNFYDIDSTNYGLVVGVDSKAYGDQWKHVYTVFGAYNDGDNKYQGVKVDTKSWMLGLKASVYNGGFYGDALINYAWHDGKAKTAFGKDNIDTTGYGAAIKAGYKHRFEKVEIDTSAMLNWQNIQSNDFKSKSGVKISTDDYSRLSLTPQVKIGYNAEPIRPYVLMRYNFILDEDGSSMLNHQLDIPSFDSKDYVEYGLGLETSGTMPHSGYAHALRHDGGRSGWSFTAGYRYNF